MITSKQIDRMLSESLKTFGSDAYFDRGPAEVMQLDLIVSELKSMPIEAVVLVLSDLIDRDTKDERNRRLIADIVIQMQDIPDSDWSVLCTADERIMRDF